MPASMTDKMMIFLKFESLDDIDVDKVGGIGPVFSKQLKDKGLNNAVDLLMVFIYLDETKDKFKSFLKDLLPTSNRKHQQDCFDSLGRWSRSRNHRAQYEKYKERYKAFEDNTKSFLKEFLPNSNRRQRQDCIDLLYQWSRNQREQSEKYKQNGPQQNESRSGYGMMSEKTQIPASITKKMRRFKNLKLICDTGVREVGGIGKILGKQLEDKGYPYAVDLLREFKGKSEDDFKSFLKGLLPNSNKKHRQDCFDSLNLWSKEHQDQYNNLREMRKMREMHCSEQ